MEILYDIPFDRILSQEEFKDALAHIVRITPEEIVMNSVLDDWADVTEQTLIVCTLVQKQEDFPLRVDVVPLKSGIIVDSGETILEKLCDVLKCRALIGYPNEYHNPYIYLEIKGIGQKHLVKLDPIKYDSGVIEILDYL